VKASLEGFFCGFHDWASVKVTAGGVVFVKDVLSTVANVAIPISPSIEWFVTAVVVVEGFEVADERTVLAVVV
jgi:hypothetical protein